KSRSTDGTSVSLVPIPTEAGATNFVVLFPSGSASLGGNDASVVRNINCRCADLSRVGHALETTGRPGAGGNARGGEVQATSSRTRGNRSAASPANVNSNSAAKTNPKGDSPPGRMDVGSKTPVGA